MELWVELTNLAAGLFAGAAGAWTVSSFVRSRLSKEIETQSELAVGLREKLFEAKYEVERLARSLQSLEERECDSGGDPRQELVLDELRSSILSDGASMWTALAARHPNARVPAPTIPVIAFTNLKGGVGKTTITLNVGAHYAAKGLRVLFVDADYQGSLTTTLAAAAQSKISYTSSFWLRYDRTPSEILEHASDLGGAFQNCAVLGSDYRLIENENKELFRWAFGETDQDLRLRLAKVLRSDEIKGRFDVVLIDAPPRLGASGVNAICAATGFVVPTKLDGMSVEPIERMLRQFRTVFRTVNPNLLLIGAVANETFRFGGYAKAERSIIAPIEVELGKFQEGASFLRHNVMDQAAIRRAAGTSAVYFSDDQAQDAFSGIASEICSSPAWTAVK
jgi:cellulose biosynthesis protein BcsQ